MNTHTVYDMYELTQTLHMYVLLSPTAGSHGKLTTACLTYTYQMIFIRPKFQWRMRKTLSTKLFCFTQPMELTKGFHFRFQQEGNWFSKVDKCLYTELLYKKTFPLHSQTRWAKLSSQPINLPWAKPFIKPLITLLSPLSPK